LLGPVEIGLVVRELTQEVGARHAGVTHAQLHDGAFLGADLAQGVANALDQCVVLLGYELDRHEQDGECFELLDGLLAGAAVLLQRLLGFLQLLGDCAETHTRDLGVGAAIAFFLFAVGVVLFLIILVVGRRLRGGLRSFRLDLLRTSGTVVVRVDVTAEDVG
jgi:hypothetical protein